MISDPGSDTVLYVDDEPQALKYFHKAFSSEFRVLTADSVEAARALVEGDAGRVAVVLSDQRMPSASGVDLLSWIRIARPQTVRILTTAFSDLASAIEAVNTGEIFRYVTKPWDIRDLRGILLRAIDIHRLQWDREALLAEKSEMLQRLVLNDQVRTHLTRLAGPIEQAGTALARVHAALPAENDQLRSLLGQANHGMERVQRSLRQLREFSDPPRASRPEIFPLGDAIAHALQQSEFAVISGWISLRCAEDAPVKAAKEPITSVLAQLIANAAAAMRDVGDGRVPKIAISTRCQGQRLVVSVRDNGIGIPSMNLPRVFEPFFTTQAGGEGLGLGLTIARSVIQQHGGTMHVRSEYGRWCEVTFDLPLAAST